MLNPLQEILLRYELPARAISAIAPSLDRGIWRVMFSFQPGDPVKLMDIGRAFLLADELYDASELNLAERLRKAADDAKRYALAGRK